MGILNSVVRSRFGKYYKVQLPSESKVELTLKPESFWNENSARQFINNLQVSKNYWRIIISQCSYTLPASQITDNDIEHHISTLIINQQLQMFSIDVLDVSEHPPENRAIKTKDNVTYLFAPLNTLLTTSPKEVKYFNNEADADEFLNEIDTDEAKMKTLAAELNIDVPGTASVNADEIRTAISTALVSGAIVVMVDRFTGSPKLDEVIIETVGPGNQKAGLAPSSTVTQPQEKDDDPRDQKSQADTLVKAASSGAAFCEECEKAKTAAN